MSTGSWVNQDNLPLQFGTQKANPEQWSDYLLYGQTRCMEGLIDLTSLGSSAQLQSFPMLFPSGYNIMIEKVEVVADVASAGGTSFSVGLGYPTSASTYSTVTTNAESSTSSSVTTTAYSASIPSVTTISDTALVSALVNASTNTQGDIVDLTVGVTSAGAYVGVPGANTSTHPCYITAKASGTYSAGLMRIRVYYRGYGTIIN